MEAHARPALKISMAKPYFAEACLAAGVSPEYVLTSAPYTDEKFGERLEQKRDVVVATASERAPTGI